MRTVLTWSITYVFQILCAWAIFIRWHDLSAWKFITLFILFSSECFICFYRYARFWLVAINVIFNRNSFKQIHAMKRTHLSLFKIWSWWKCQRMRCNKEYLWSGLDNKITFTRVFVFLGWNELRWRVFLSFKLKWDSLSHIEFATCFFDTFIKTNATWQSRALTCFHLFVCHLNCCEHIALD